MSERRYHRDDEPDVEIIDAPAEKYADAEHRRESSGRQFGLLQISDYENESRSILAVIEMAGGRTANLNVTYDPARVNDSLNDQIRQLSEDGDALAAATIFCEVVTDWGVMGELTAKEIATDENDKVVRDEHGAPVWKRRVIVPTGERVPLEPTVVQYVRSDVIIGIWQEIQKDASGGKSREKSKRRRWRGR